MNSITERRGVVVGCPRSGTTFLSRIFNAAPGVESLIGTLYPVALPHLANHVEGDTKKVLALALERSIDEYLHSGRCWSRAMSLQKWFNAPTGVAGLAAAMKGKRRIDIMIYKEPMLSFAPELAVEAFPNGRIIHIVRDGRDTANSMVRTYGSFTDERLMESPINIYGILGRTVRGYTVPWWVEEGREDEFIASTPYVRSIWMWRYVVRRCTEYFAQPEIEATGNVITVRYETLMRNPEEEGARIMDHLGIEMSKTFRQRLATAHEGSIGKHEKRDAAEVKAAESVAGDMLTSLGYL